MAQESGNGASWSGPRLTPLTETTVFRIGSTDIEVPALNLCSMELAKAELLSLGPNLDWITYAVNVVHIIYTALKVEHPEMTLSERELLLRCSLKEMRELPVAMNKLLDVSGFDSGTDPNAEAARETQEIPGTGISTPSSPISSPEESAQEIPT